MSITVDLPASPGQIAVGRRDDVVEMLRRHEPEIRGFGATALFLFGSAARDEMTAASDVDVFIDCETEGSFSLIELIGLKEYLGDVVGRKVDVMTRDGLHRVLKAGIEQSSLRIF